MSQLSPILCYSKIQMNNIFEEIPTDLRQEVFQQIQTGEHVTIERILSKGHSSPASGWYDQERHEWVLVLQGEAELSFENRPPVHLKAGDFINIPSHTRHRVDWTAADRETIWLAVHY